MVHRLVLLLAMLATTPALAQDHYAGLQLAPSAHLGLVHQKLIAGAGAELSIGRWLVVELTLSGLTAGGARVPGSLQTSLGVYSRAGGDKHTFVYGAGLSYANRYGCERYCTVFAAVAGPEESRIAHDLLTVDLALGYEMRTDFGLFMRPLLKWHAPVYLSDLSTRDYGPEEYSFGANRSPFFLTHIAVHLTVGYAFKLRP